MLGSGQCSSTNCKKKTPNSGISKKNNKKLLKNNYNI